MSDYSCVKHTDDINTKVMTINPLLQSLMEEIAQSEVVRPARKPFRVQTFDLGADVTVDREAMYTERVA